MQPTNSLFFITIAPFQMVMKAFAKTAIQKRLGEDILCVTI